MLGIVHTGIAYIFYFGSIDTSNVKNSEGLFNVKNSKKEYKENVN